MKKIFAIISLILTLALIIGGIVIALVLRESQAPEDTSAAESTASYPFNGTFISFFELDPKLTDSYLKEKFKY